MTGDEHGPDMFGGQLRQWRRVHPDLDTSGMAVIGRINRCAVLFQQAEDASLVDAGVSRAEFVTLAAMRRTDRPLTPSQIARETASSGAAVTKRLRRLEERGLISRRADGRDRRSSWLSLTEEGRALIDRLLPTQTEYERALLSGLGDGRQQQLADLLAELLVHLEGRLGGYPS